MRDVGDAQRTAPQHARRQAGAPRDRVERLACVSHALAGAIGDEQGSFRLEYAAGAHQVGVQNFTELTMQWHEPVRGLGLRSRDLEELVGQVDVAHVHPPGFVVAAAGENIESQQFVGAGKRVSAPMITERVVRARRL